MSVSGNLTGTYTYDAAGNLTGETTTRQFEWDHANRLATFRVQTGGATPSKYAQYRYDATGERAIKVVRKGAAQDEITIYVGGFERSLTGSIAGQLTPYDEIHLTDHDTRLAMIQRGAPHPADGITGQPVRYQLADHLASVIATLDPAGAVLNTEEYLPYGETSFGSYQRKRYRHTGKERDNESGLDYHVRPLLRALAGPLDERRPQRPCRRMESVPILPCEPRHGQRPRRPRHADIA